MVFGGLVTRIGRFNLPAENDIPSYFPGLITQEAAPSVELILQPSSSVVTWLSATSKLEARAINQTIGDK